MAQQNSWHTVFVSVTFIHELMRSAGYESQDVLFILVDS